MGKLAVRIKIDANTFLHYYQGKIKTVIAMSDDGKRISMPVNILKPFITKQGISGHFLIEFDDFGKIIDICNLGN